MLSLLKRKQFWGILIGLGLLFWCLKGINVSDVVSLLQRVHYGFLLYATLAAFCFVIFRALRWQLMIARQTALGIPRAVVLYSAGQVMNIIMPMLTGQVGRLFLFSQRLHLRKTFIFSTIVMEILFDAVSLIVFMLFTSLAFVFPHEYRFVSFVVAGVTAAVLIGFYVILHYQRRLEDSLRDHLAPRWPGIYVAIKKFIRSFVKGIALLRSSQHLVATLFTSLLAWTAHMLVIYLMFEAFGFNLPIAAAAAIMIINSIALMIPITPGNAGTFEVVVSTSLVAFSIGRTDAVLFALGLHLLDLLPGVLMGFASLRLERVSIKDMRSEAEQGDLSSKISEEGLYVDEKEV